ncbi:hypothetical protein [Oceanobacillus sp. FSL H7-0719]|uniref:hypothetical protein n=1 Tax=Oceanobacillus sp. FSL H7-0719 TaxID=2954507 RepID=UPI0032477DBB
MLNKHKDKSSIPQGHYCYDENGVACPYWSIDKSKPHQENGYCSFMEVGDWQDDRYGLLWDMVKECGIKDEVEL